MNWKIAAAALATAAIVSAPLAGAVPGNGNGNGNGHGKRPATPPGQTISAIAKNGGGAAGVLGALIQLRPTNLGLQNAFKHVTATKTTTPSPTTQTTTPNPTTQPTTPNPTTDTSAPSPTTDTSAPSSTSTPTP